MLKPNKIKIYNASAGAGKTYTLVKEFLSLLFLKPETDAFKKLLAITFTNKAANEMKVRIVEKLQELTDLPDEDSEMKTMMKETGLSPDAIRLKSRNILTSILHNYGLFAVSTIDKFNLRLMRAFSQDLGISVNFDVEMDTRQMLSESVDLLFSELQDEKLLSDIMTDIALENLSNDQRWDISDDMIQQSNDLLQDKFLEPLQQLQKLSLEEFNAFRNMVNRKYFAAKLNIDKAAKDVLDYTKNQGLSIEDFKYKNSGSVLKYFLDIEDGKYLLFGPRAEKLFESGAYLSNKSADIDALTSVIADAYAVIQENLRDYNFWSKIKKKINPITLLNEVDKRLNKVKEENNILLIGDFNKIISDNIKDQPTPFIYEKIGNRYHHYFIDEFQDTSDLQWQNLLPLVLNALSDDMTVMIVGDPKQSIYRFRGGNPNLMIGLADMEDTDERIEVESLPTNWRSYHEVINFNNALYEFIGGGLNHPGFKALYESAGQEENHKKGGYVQLRFEPKPQKGSGESHLENCMYRLLEDIQKAEENGFAWEEMAILVRTNSQGQLIAEFLSEKGYQIISNESLLLQNSDHVQLLLAFIQFLTKPTNSEYRINLILRLYQNHILNVEDKTEFIANHIGLNENDFIQVLKKRDVDLEFLKLPFQSFYDQVSAAVRAFRLQENANAYVSFFMDEILKFQYQPDPTPQAFLVFWEQKAHKLSIVIPEGQKAIQLLTLHKSKGLQFPVVFLPYITWEPKSSGIWIPVEDEKVKQIYIEDLNDMEQMPAEVQERIIEEEIQAELDALNMLYVATTRAVEQLYMVADVPGKSDLPVASYLFHFAGRQEGFEDNCISFGSPERVSTLKERNNQNQMVVPFVSSDWTQKVKISEEHAMLWDDSRAEALEYGRKMHSVLEKINHISETDDVLDQFELQGFITAEEKTQLSVELKKLFEHQDLSALFNAEEFYNERDFVAPDGNLFRPDRLVKLNEDWILMDYKTGEPKKKYEKQVNDYAQFLTDLGMPVKRKLLIFLDQKETVVEVD
ncbi:UvrD-helicase domain-containing protein [Weeksellaceae bacterium KMM 9724]|uniref:UvrD-helicase domain-containing protein n=1 Tax=Profundicola chukchiensis TaxID=2961959 RepID=UPI002437541C|nr:UvrD-helicase domain-containing protein [Profundicola chukchiensis]MDG4950872.1 UvrD-helicase domain-containing protein [Profundicola chukchiensis]